MVWNRFVTVFCNKTMEKPLFHTTRANHTVGQGKLYPCNLPIRTRQTRTLKIEDEKIDQVKIGLIPASSISLQGSCSCKLHRPRFAEYAGLLTCMLQRGHVR